MDIFGTTVTVIHEIYTITVFIKGVVEGVRSYGDDTVMIRQKLAHEFVYVESFQSNFFEDDANAEAYKKQSKMLQEDVKSTLENLKKLLAEYGIEAAKHGILIDDDDDDDDDDDAAKVKTQVPNQHARTKKDKISDRLRKFINGVRSDAKELRNKTMWSLFDKDKIMETLAEYSEWTNRLRQCSALMTEKMLLKGLKSFAEFTDTKSAKDLGLQDVAKRRSLINGIPPDTFTSLDGFIVPRSERVIASNVVFAKFQANGTPDPVSVLIEHRAYNHALLQAVASKNEDAIVDKLKLPYKQLAWMLNQSPFPEDTDSDSIMAATHPTLLTLQCIGYIDQPAMEQVQFLYEPPKLGAMQEEISIKTLHGLIMGSKSSEPNSDTFFLHVLEDCWTGTGPKVNGHGRGVLRKQTLRIRFFLAYALATTVLNIHSSGWVHKNLWSHNIIIVPSTKPSKQSGTTYLVPYVAGWDVARPTTVKDTDLKPDYSAEANLYRHPNRQQRPAERYTLIHDLYSLGILLMEIGLWDAVGNHFHTQLQWEKKCNRAPPVDMIRKAWKTSIKTEIQRQMGDSYANAVGCCLLSDFGVDRPAGGGSTDAESNLAVGFKNLVIDAIKPCITI